MTAQLVAWVGGGSTLALIGVVVYLAVRLVAAADRVSTAVAARLAAEAQADRDQAARVAAEAERDAAVEAKKRVEVDLADAQKKQGDLYAKLRSAGAPGAGSVVDDDIRKLYPDADDPGPGAGGRSG